MGGSLKFSDGNKPSKRIIRVARDGDTGPMGSVRLRNCKCGTEFLTSQDFRYCESCRKKMSRINA